MAHHRIFQRCLLKDYRDVAHWFSKARNKANGRKYGKWALIRRDGNDAQGRSIYVLHIHGTPVCRITPDNILTFLMDGRDSRAVSPTLSSSLHRLIPVSWIRVGMGRYRILATGSMEDNDSWFEKSRQGPELYAGLKLDLSRHAFINARPDMMQSIDPAKRREWLRAMRRFRKDMIVRAKLGTFDALADEMNHKDNTDKFAGRYPQWHRDDWVSLLHKEMVSGQYSKTLLAALLVTVPKVTWSFRRNKLLMAEKIKLVVDSVIKSNSIALREKFGVFNYDEVEDGKAKQV